MVLPIGFDSWKQFSNFIFAREFVDNERYDLTLIRSSRVEKIGHALAGILLKPLDLVLRELRNPVVIVALTVASLLISSIIFYPIQTMAVATRSLPVLQYIRAWHMKGGLYAISQTMIFGLGLRAVGRLSNSELMEAFQEKQMFPIPVGAVRIR